MSFALAQRASSLPLAVRMFFLVVSVACFLLLSTGGVGGQTTDDHGNTLSTASDLRLGFSIKGRIDPSNDQDVFKLDLSGVSGTTDIWIYTTGDLDTVGGLFDSGANLLTVNDDSLIVDRWINFHLRASLTPGVYYVAVLSYRNEYVGDYTLHSQAVTDPGSTIDTAARLRLDSPTPGTIGTANNAGYFRLELTRSTDLVIFGVGVSRAPVDVVVLDSGSNEIITNMYPYPQSIFGLPRYGFWIRDNFGPGTYYFKIFTQSDVNAHPVPYTIHAFEDVRYTDFIDECEADTLLLNTPLISDPLYACQWHLNSLYGEDINVESVWAEGIKGEGVNVAVVDDGMYYTHQDLKDNVDKSRNHDYAGEGDIYTPFEHHGTHVAGIIAARDNDIGVRGVAPRATVYGYNYLAGESSDVNRADAMTRDREVTAVSNNSWGPVDGPGPGPANVFWELAIETGVTAGYGGKGIFYTFSGGNGHVLGDDSNLDELANFYGVTAVCAVNDHDTRSSFSEKGANLWVCAPSNDLSDLRQGLLTTENSDRYYEEFGGTSASTPIVTGVVALMRSANPDLTWRDLKLILAASARKNDARNPDWEDGAHKYGATSDSDRYHFNHEYGFGVVDAKAAVDLSKGWRSLPSFERSTIESNRLNLPISDAPAIGPTETVTNTIRLDSSISFVEFVEVKVSFRHDSFRDLKVELESPSGAVSQLAVPYDTRNDDDTSYAFVPLHGTFRFGSARHLGENPNGVWKLRVTDHISTVSGPLDSWSVTVYGHESPPGVPTVDSVTPGVGTLTVTWIPPEESGSSPVTAYDLRHIQTAADEAVNSNWTVVEDVWTAANAVSLEHVITALVGGVRYDVQVRAVNSVGAGPWSNTVTGTPIHVTTGACGTEGAVADPDNNPGLVSDCNSLLAARDALAGSATLNWSAATPIADWAGVTVGGSPQRVTALGLYNSSLTGAIPTELGRLASLKRLVLSKNRLTGPVPTWLSDLADLEELSLWGNRLSGPIPTALGDLVNLNELYLSQNQLTGPIPASLGDLTNLQELSLWRNELTGPLPDELGSLINLQRLVLSQNQLTGPLPVWLGDLTNLQALSLWGNDFIGPVPDELGNLANLKELYLAQNGLTGPIPTSLGNIANLEVLSLWRNRLTGPIPAELGNLTNLEGLLFRENRLTGSIPASLGELDNLQSLSLRQNQLVGCIPEGLRDVARNDFDDLDLPFCDVLLSDLVISPGSLVQPFDPFSTDYTVLASASQITLTPVNEHNATLMFLDRNHHEIADADVSLDGHQVDLKTFITVIRIRVTSHNGLSTYTYNIAVRRAPGAPAMSEVSSGDGYLTVSWTAPDETGGSDITAYDLRYIQASADETVDSNWAVLEDVWTAAAGGDLQYSIAGLTGSMKYDVQVRALNHAGPGPWSEPATESTAPSVCVTDGAVADATNTGLISDCEALLTARDTLAGTGSLNWAADTSMIDWDGVTLRGTPARVAWLNIRGGGLDGSLPASLGRLSYLSYLNLRSNDLKGRIPAELGNLTNLRVLNLHSNRLSGSIPESLGNLSNLVELWLHANHRKDEPTSGLSGRIPESLGKLSNLEKMKLRNNRLSGPLPASLGRLDKLKWLVAHNNQLSGQIPSELGDMDSLEILWLGGNELSGSIPPQLGRLTNLSQLHLRTNEFTGSIPAELKDLTSLKRLWIHQNQLTGSIPEELGDLSNLEILNLRSNELDGLIPDRLDSLSPNPPKEGRRVSVLRHQEGAPAHLG